MFPQLNLNVPRFRGHSEFPCDKPQFNGRQNINLDEAIDSFELSTPKKSKYQEFIPLDSTPKEVRDILADKDKVGRSFWGYKGAIKNKIENSENPELAIENLNFLLNVNDKELLACDVNAVLEITENINNSSNEDSEYFKKHFNFNGGKLDEESFDRIQKKRIYDAQVSSALYMEQKRRSESNSKFYGL